MNLEEDLRKARLYYLGVEDTGQLITKEEFTKYYKMLNPSSKFRSVKSGQFTTDTKPSVDTADCIIWTKAKTTKGYGRRYSEGKLRYVHRLEWEKHNGPIPEGMYICHHCDNPSCYNINHLFIGTQKDNIADMISKGRNTLYKKDLFYFD